MRVAVDATPLALTSGGLARYTSELVLALTAQFPEDEYYPISDQIGSRNLGALDRRWWMWGLQREMNRLGAEIFHGTDFAVPYLPTRPSVMSLHDLSPWMDRAWHHNAGRVRRRTPPLIKMGIATMIVTDSQAVRMQAIEHFRIHPDRVVAIPLAASAQFRPTGGAGDSPARSRPYFLYVGALEPRKNLVGLLTAYARLRTPRPPLYVAGGAGWRFSPIFDTVTHLHLQDDVHFVGFVPEDDLPLWYNAARLFAFPSLYEGFGLPVLEAMDCGTPVITSTAASLPEVAGQATVLVPPQDTDRLAQEMERVLDDPQRQMEMRAAGRIQASRFSWRTMTDQTVASYQRAIGA